MKKIFIAVTLLVSIGSHAQTVEMLHDFPLDDSLSVAEIEAADFDNDGLLDVAIIGAGSVTKFIRFIKGDTLTTPMFTGSFIFIDPFSSYSIVDVDNDNDLDIIFFSTASALYRNNGNFSFTKQPINLPAFKKSLWVDLNNDGQREIVGNFLSGGNDRIVVFEGTGATWQPVGDSFQLSLSSIQLVDADFDGNQDVFVSGRFDADSLYSGVLINESDFKLNPAAGQEWSGISAAGDIDHDGIFDITMAGIDAQSNQINRLVLSERGISSEVLQLSTTASVFVADFNSDGQADINLFGQNGSDWVNLIQVASADYDTLPADHVILQRFADVDRDGDLDLIQITKPDSLHVVFYEYKTTKNNGPLAPTAGIGFPIYNRYFLFWRQSGDDHTASKSLTYDLVVNPIQSGEFDLLNERRLRTYHGNNLTQNFKLLSLIPPSSVSIAAQGIDNAYAAKLDGGGICMGGGAGAGCLKIEEEVMQVCKNEEIVLNSPPTALWFSFADGFLGTLDQLSMQVEESDTLFYFDPAAQGCYSLKTIRIEIRNSPRVDYFEKYVCEQQIIQLEVEENWETVSWSSLAKGNLGTQNSIAYTASVEDSIFVHLTNAEGCDLIRKTAIHISKPPLTVEEESYIILKGHEVQLQASGAERYQWSPDTHLSSSTISNPIASPLINTIYTVIGYDSIDCPTQKTVQVFVEDTGFVPNLFTPNNDDKNDELKIYGLNATTELSFSIYNREGKLVYETMDVVEATHHGWDGAKNGVKQPAGVYFWKVSGKLRSGGPVLLNGKKEGSIVLVR